MDFQRAHDLLGNEIKCLLCEDFDTDCSQCEYSSAESSKELIEAYKLARYALRYVISESSRSDYVKFFEDRGFE